MKYLVAYFSAEGKTASLASALGSVINADMFEIVPEKPYTAADIKWTNPLSRCNREKFGKMDVPVAGVIEDFDQYSFVFLGFPIWYGAAPNIVNTFCKAYDWSGKKVAVFATSGGSGIGKTAERLQPFLRNGAVCDARIFSGVSDLLAWAEGLL